MILQPIECIICRSKKTEPGSSVYEDLTKCTKKSGSESLLLFAEESPDDCVRAQLLGMSVNDVLAREYFYHRSCQRNITLKQKNRGNEEYKTRKECFENLVTYVRNNLISRGELSTMRKLSSYYKQLQTEKNIPVKGVAHKDVKRKLQFEFGGELLFYQESRTQSYFTYHKSVPTVEDERRLKG